MLHLAETVYATVFDVQRQPVPDDADDVSSHDKGEAVTALFRNVTSSSSQLAPELQRLRLWMATANEPVTYPHGHTMSVADITHLAQPKRDFDHLCIWVHAQGFGVVVSAHQDDVHKVHVCFLDVLVPTEAIMRTAALKRTYPTHNNVWCVDVHEDNHQQWASWLRRLMELAKNPLTLSCPHRTKGGQDHNEHRENVMPHVGIGILQSLLHNHLDARCIPANRVVSKKVHTRVEWYNSKGNLQRAPTWLGCKALLSYVLPQSCYKQMMLWFARDVYASAISERPFDEQVEACTKLGRRLRKHQMAHTMDGVGDVVVNDVAKDVQLWATKLQQRWHHAIGVATDNPPNADDDSTSFVWQSVVDWTRAHALLAAEPYNGVPTCDEPPAMRLHTKVWTLFRAFCKDDNWVGTPTTEEWDALYKQLQHLVANDPYAYSRMILLRLVELVVLHRAARAYDALLDDHPVTFYDEGFAMLLLATHLECDVLHKVRTYFASFTDDGLYDEVLCSNVSWECYAYRHVTESQYAATYNRLETVITQHSEKLKEDKRREVEQWKSEFGRRSQDTWCRKPNIYCYCGGCENRRWVDSNRNTQIQVHENILPTNDTLRKCVLFECQVPKAFARFRDHLHILHVYWMTHAVQRGQPKTEENWQNHLALRLGTSQSVSKTRVTLVSCVKTLERDHTGRKCHTEPIDKFLDNENPLDGALAWWLGRQRKREIASTGSSYRLPQRTTLTLPEPYHTALNDFHCATPREWHGAHNRLLTHQDNCPSELSLAAYKELGTFRSVHPKMRLHYVCKLLEASSPVDLNACGVVNFIEQVIHSTCQHVEQCAKDDYTDEQQWRGTMWQQHPEGETANNELVSACAEALHRVLDRREGTWENVYALYVVLHLAQAIATRGRHLSHVQLPRVKFRVRKIALRWLDELASIISEHQTGEHEERIAEWRAQCVRVACVGVHTFTLRKYQDSKKWTAQEWHTWFRMVNTLKEDHTGNETADDCAYDTLLLRRTHETIARISHTWWEEADKSLLSCACSPELTTAFHRVLTARGITVPSQTACTRRPETSWCECVVNNTSESKPVVHINLRTGHYLVNGKPVGRLEDDVCAHADYIRLFGNAVMDVYPLGGNAYRTKHPRSGWHFRFAPSPRQGADGGERRIEQVHAEDEQCTFLYVPERCVHDVQPKLPSRFVTTYAHWWQADSLQFRPMDDCFEADATAHCWSARTRQLTTSHDGDDDHYLQPYSPALARGRFARLDTPNHLAVWVNAKTERRRVDVLRFAYVFHEETNGWTCKQHNGFRIADDQRLDTFVGLYNVLVLCNSVERVVLVPYGDEGATTENTAPKVHHVTKLRHPEEARTRRRMCTYTLNTHLRLLTPLQDDRLSFLYLAWLHGVTSNVLRDPFTGRTGTEHALDVFAHLGYPSTPYTADECAMLHQLAQLSATRKFYPPKKRVQERIDWERTRPSQSQTAAFAVLVHVCMQEHYTLCQAYDTPPSSPEALPKLPTTEQLPLYARALHRHPHVLVTLPARVHDAVKHYVPMEHVVCEPVVNVADVISTHDTTTNETKTANNVKTLLYRVVEECEQVRVSPSQPKCTTLHTWEERLLCGGKSSCRGVKPFVLELYGYVRPHSNSLTEADTEDVHQLLTCLMHISRTRIDDLQLLHALQYVLHHPDAFAPLYCGVCWSKTDDLEVVLPKDYKRALYATKPADYNDDDEVSYNVRCERWVSHINPKVWRSRFPNGLHSNAEFVYHKCHDHSDALAVFEHTNDTSYPLRNDLYPCVTFNKATAPTERQSPPTTHRNDLVHPLAVASIPIHFDATVATAIFNDWAQILGYRARSVPIVWLRHLYACTASADVHKALVTWARTTHHVSDVGDSVVSQPHWLALEHVLGVRIRERQVEIAQHLLGRDEMTTPPNVLTQLDMGEGKTSVILPMLALALSDGERLCRVQVPAPLFPENYQKLHWKLGWLGVPLLAVPCTRTAALPAHEMQTHYEALYASGGVLLQTPEHVRSFALRSNNEPAYDAVHQWSHRHIVDMLDEADDVLHPRHQLIYPHGDPVLVDGSDTRWSTYGDLLEAWADVVKDAHEHDCNAIDTIVAYRAREGAHVFPREVRLLQPAGAEPLWRKVVAKVLAKHRCAIKWTGAERVDWLRRVMDTTCDLDTKDTGGDDESCNHLLYTLRGSTVFGILQTCLSKRHNVEYGVDKRRKSPLAVPYRAKGVPADRAEWSHPDTQLLWTYLSWLYTGLDREDFDTMMVRMTNVKANERRYTEWHHSVANTVPWDSLNLSDKTQADSQYALLHTHIGVVRYWLEFHVFHVYAKTFPCHQSASACDTVHAGTRCIGFSGTNGSQDVLPHGVSQCDLPSVKTTNDDVDELLTNQRSGCTSVHSSELPAQLRTILDAHPTTRVLIDRGALLDGTGIDVARAWLEQCRSCSQDKPVRGVIYYDDTNMRHVLRRGADVGEPFDTSPLVLDECAVYLDDAHTRGVDFRFALGTHAVVTLHKGLTRDDLAQACKRMRKLHETTCPHTLGFVAPPDVCNEMDSTSTAGVLRWSYANTKTTNVRLLMPWADHEITYAKGSKHRVTPQCEDVSPRPYTEPDCFELVRYTHHRTDTTYAALAQASPFITIPHVAKRIERVGKDQSVACIAQEQMVQERELEHEQQLDEEQERELEHELEEQRESERPPRATPHVPTEVHERLIAIAHGKYDKSTTCPFAPALDDGWSPICVLPDDTTLWVTEEYARVRACQEACHEGVRACHEACHEHDLRTEYHRLPIWYVADTRSGNCLGGTCEEVAAMWDEMRTTRFQLRMAGKRQLETTSPLLDEDVRLCVPRLPKPTPVAQRWQVSVFVGAVHYKPKERQALLQWVHLNVSIHTKTIRTHLQLSDSLPWFWKTPLDEQLLRLRHNC